MQKRQDISRSQGSTDVLNAEHAYNGRLSPLLAAEVFTVPDGPAMGRCVPTDRVLSCPPLVDYEDFVEYVDLYSQMHQCYTGLILKAVASRQLTCKLNWPSFSQRDLMLVGLAEFDNMLHKGLRCALKVTKKRGLRFCMMLNESVIDAVTTACRTFITTITGIRHTLDIHIPIDYDMMTSAMIDAMYSASGHCDTYTGLIGKCLFDTNFVQWVSSSTVSVIPRSRVQHYLFVFAMAGQQRLAPHLHHVQLGDDMLRLIFKYI